MGKKLPMFVIGKSKTPRCFKHIKQLPCTYRNQLKSWMTGDLFTVNKKARLLLSCSGQGRSAPGG